MKKIIAEGLKYKYPDGERLALDDLNFEIEEGEFIGIAGANGAGKSTLCYALTGLIPHFFKGGYGGKVTVAGKEVRQAEIHEIAAYAGLVFDNPFTQMTGSKFTVFEELAFGLENQGMDRQTMIKRIEEILQLLHIEHIKERNPFDLSGGQMQRVAIASILVMKPDILILDEPTSQLDPQGTEEIFQVVEQLANEGITIIMVEQKIEKLAQYADRILLIHEGKQVDFTTPEKLFSREDLQAYGIRPPVFTRVAKAAGIVNKETNCYPVTKEQFLKAVGKSDK
ncbi:ABC transporter ATP-binding protein [Bacillaceae bacterium Marseille-Q3522]|nr:ABC transporter ATP-binding protein [Bacillaceae bacterium Marseille-Q3522]